MLSRNLEQSLHRALALATKHRHEFATLEHLLLALTEDQDAIAGLRACGGDLDRVSRIVKLGGFVNSTPEFTDQPKVINGASDLMVAVFGDKGQHCRAAVSAGAVPLGVAVGRAAAAEVA